MTRYLVGAIVWGIFGGIFLITFLSLIVTNRSEAIGPGIIMGVCLIAVAINSIAYTKTKKKRKNASPITSNSSAAVPTTVGSQQIFVDNQNWLLNRRIKELEKRNTELEKALANFNNNTLNVTVNASGQLAVEVENLKKKKIELDNDLRQTEFHISYAQRKLDDLNREIDEKNNALNKINVNEHLIKDQQLISCISDSQKGLDDLNKGIDDKSNSLNSLNSEIAYAKSKLAETQDRVLQQTQKLNQLKIQYNDIYNEIKNKAVTDALSNLKQQLEQLETDKAKGIKDLEKLNAQLKTLNIKYTTIKNQYQSYYVAVKSYINHGERHLNETFINSLSPTVEIELQCFSVRQLRKLYNQNKALIQECFERYEKRYTTKTNAALYKLMTIALEAELQNVLFDIKYGKLETAIDNIDKMCERYYTIATDGNQSIVPTVKKFISEIEYLFVEAVKIEYEYYVQRERIKEEQRTIREQMRQEAEERKELERERKRIEQEEQKYRNEIENIRIQLETAEQERIQVLKDRISELEKQIGDVEDKREQILSLENGKAGYVYIISNIGSFGDDVYKIGMTRRLEPMERIHELGSASVPFPFDVHGLIFSDDAVGLEHDLHAIFTNNRVNKVNLRKEFFNVSLDEIEKIVEERCPSAEFKRTALAEQYRQSLEMSTAADELNEDNIKEDVYKPSAFFV